MTTDTMPQPDWSTPDGAIKLYRGDCLDLLPQLPEGCVDAVVTDIPYDEVNRQSGGLRNLDKQDADVATFTLDDVVRHSSRLASGSVYIWCGIEQVSGLRSGFVKAGMTTRLGVWEKSNPSPMNGERLWLSSLECCVFARHSKAYFAEHCESPVWRGPVQHRQKHPTQKPVWLMGRLVNASVPYRGVVLDFCAGSGTTGVACVKTGRNFIGIEREPKYFAIARYRIEQALEDQALFRQAEGVSA